MAEMTRSTGLASALFYRDPKAALRFLERAFGFEPSFILLDSDGNVAHSQMSFGSSRLMVGGEWSDNFRSPASLDGKNSQMVHVQLGKDEDIEAHCKKARAAGATIIQEPEMQFYGDRTYRASDPEGHVWTFNVTVKEMESDDWDEAGGFTMVSRLD